MPRWLLGTLALLVTIPASRGAAAAPETARNVIVLIADGAGYNTWLATSMFAGTLGADFHDEPGWVTVAASTYALREALASEEAVHGAGAAGPQDPTLVYDPALAWDRTPTEGGPAKFPYFFAGYRWLRRAPDSANTGTALATGRKTFVGAVNVDGFGRPIEPTIASLAKASGRRTGVVTSVPWSHATPATLGGAHHVTRRATCAIAVEMLTSGTLDVIAGCGNPDFDANGKRRGRPTQSDYQWVGGRWIWDVLTGHATPRPGDLVCGERARESRELTAEEVAVLQEWKLVQRRAEIEPLVQGDTPARLLIVPEVDDTLQQERSAARNAEDDPPGADPRLADVPTLETLTRVALNALDDHPGGFYLMVEGGAVDWAMHDNRLGRTVEEMLDFRATIGAVIEWVKDHGGWEESLVVVTADHDHLLAGPNADRMPFDPLEDRGAGRLPGHRWLSDGHSAALVPVFARGTGSERLLELAVREDPVHGRYLDQTDVFRVLAAALGEGTAASD